MSVVNPICAPISRWRQALMAELFQTTPQNVTLHLKALHHEGKIAAEATCKDYLQVRLERDRQVRRTVLGDWEAKLDERGKPQ